MRMAFGLIALLIVLAIISVLAKHQLKAVQTAVPVVPGASEPASGNVAQQSRQMQQQVADQVNQMMQQRPKQLDEQQP